MPNASGKIDGTTVDVGEREQVDEVAVLERPGEERPRRGDALELLAVVAEADDHGARVELAQRLEQQVDALVVEQLPEVDDRRLVVGEELGEALGVAVVREALVARCRVRRIAAGLVEQRGERLVPRLGAELVDVDAGRHLVDAVDVADDLLEHLADVLRADEDGLGAARATPSPTPASSAFPRIEYSSSEPCALTAKRTPLADADRAAEQDVVGEDEVGRAARARTAAAFSST